MPTSSPAPRAFTMLCAGAMHGIIADFVDGYERETGAKTRIEFTRSGLVRDRIAAGERFDLVVTTAAAVAELAALAKILPDTAIAVAHSGIGVAVRAGVDKPSIASTADFVHMLRGARSIAYADPASGSPSGKYLVGLFDRLGIAAELAPKTRLAGAKGGEAVVVCDLVAGGAAEIGIQQISEILPVSGVELVGPLPAELQHLTTFSAAVSVDANDPPAGRRLVSCLSSPAAAALITAHGMEPV